MAATLAFRDTRWTPPTLNELGAEVASGFWTATVVVVAPDGTRIEPRRFNLSESATEGSVLDEIKTRWATARDVSAVTVTAPQRARRLQP